MTRRLAPLLLAALAGCGDPAPPTAPPPPTAAEEPEHHGHTHTRDAMKVAHVGPYHAWLTAHLSAKDGNELDVFFETGDGQPAALPFETFAATARRGDGTEFPLRFEPAPVDERPKGEPAGTCSHFVAKAGPMTAADTLAVTAKLVLDGKPRTATWRNFGVRKYAHHVE